MRKIKSRRIVNNRPMCFCALALLVGILLGECLSFVNPLFRLIPLCVFSVAFALFAIKKRLRKFAYLFAAVIVGIIAMSAADDLNKSKRIGEVYAEFQATVSSEIIIEDGETEFYVDNIILGEKKLDGECRVTFKGNSEPDFGAGDIIKLKGYITDNERKIFDSFYAMGVSKGLYYKATCFSVIKTAESDPVFPLNLQIKLKKMIFGNLDEITGSVCQALLLGDKFGIDGEFYQNVKRSGVAHVLAVSGLHITAVAALLYALLKKLKAKPKINTVIVTAATFFYVLLCSFTPSALRAFIMTFVFSAARVSGKKSDNLSALSFAAILIMLFNPYAVMDVGFLLSVFAVLGVFTFYRPFKRFGMRAVEHISPVKKRGKFIVESFAVTLAANVFTLPITAYFFGEISLLMLITNLIIVPYVMFIYQILLIIAIFALITGLGSAFSVMEYAAFPFVWATTFFGSIPFASVKTGLSACGVVFGILTAFCFSPQIFLTKRQRAVAALSVLAVWLTVSFVVSAGVPAAETIGNETRRVISSGQVLNDCGKT